MVENFQIEYKLSLYESLTIFSKTEKATVDLVQNSLDERIYIRKTLKNYNVEVYKLLQQIENINLPKIYEVIEYENTLTIIEEFINGRTLQDILDSQDKIDEDKVIKYTMTLCKVLEVIHGMDKPIIHRDIKPSNIIIDNYGVLKLIDFDASRVFKNTSKRDTHILGTEGYAAPEQFGFLQTDSRSDIYSIGILMNVLITGKHPREEEVDSELRKIIAKCIEINPKHRYSSTIELRKELNKIKDKRYASDKKYLDDKTIRFEIPHQFMKKELLDTKEDTIISESKNASERYVDDKKERKKALRWLNVVPGYRTKKELNQLVATVTYVILGIGLFLPSDEMEKLTLGVFLENLCIVCTTLGIVFIWTNFYNIHSYLPGLKTNDKSLKNIICFLYSCVVMFIFGGFLSFFMEMRT